MMTTPCHARVTRIGGVDRFDVPRLRRRLDVPAHPDWRLTVDELDGRRGRRWRWRRLTGRRHEGHVGTAALAGLLQLHCAVAQRISFGNKRLPGGGICLRVRFHAQQDVLVGERVDIVRVVSKGAIGGGDALSRCSAVFWAAESAGSLNAFSQ